MELMLGIEGLGQYVLLLYTVMLRISSYNCQSSKRNIGGISKLCNVSDIVFIQEHWLFPSDLPILNNIHHEFMSYGISSIDPSDGLLLGRPYGGVAVMWKNKLASHVKPISYDDDRIVGLECHLNGIKVLLLGVYLPYDSRHNFDQYVYYLAKLKSIIDEFDSPYVCILGDFNADVIKQSEFGKELEAFCYECNLDIADVMMLPQPSVTHVNDGNGTESWLDHIVCTKAFYSVVHNVHIDLSIVSSDHFPMSLKVDLTLNDCPDSGEAPECDDNGRWVVDWTLVDDASLNKFAVSVEEELSNIIVPYDVVHCRTSACHVHKDAIRVYYEEIVNCIRNASRSTVAKRIGGRHKRSIPGWSEFVEDRHTLLGDIYSLWALIGKPRQGYIYSQLRIARSQFKYALRFCLKNEKDLRAKALADKFAKHPRDLTAFWKEVRKLNGNTPLAQSVAGVSGEASIANMWKDHFSGILNSVNNDTSKDSVLKQLVDSDSSITAFSVREVLESIF